MADRYRDLAVKATAIDLELFARRASRRSSTNWCRNARSCVTSCAASRWSSRARRATHFTSCATASCRWCASARTAPQRVLRYLRAGEYFGEMALFETAARWASVLTAGKCELIKIDRDDFLELCRRYPQMSKQMPQDHQSAPRSARQKQRHAGNLGPARTQRPAGRNPGRRAAGDGPRPLHQMRQLRERVRVAARPEPADPQRHPDRQVSGAQRLPPLRRSQMHERCPTGAIKRRPEGEIYFQYDMCIGCGNCAIACPTTISR